MPEYIDQPEPCGQTIAAVLAIGGIYLALPRNVAGAHAHAHGDPNRSATRLTVDRALDAPGAGDRGPGGVEYGQAPVPERLDLPAAVRGDHIA